MTLYHVYQGYFKLLSLLLSQALCIRSWWVHHHWHFENVLCLSNSFIPSSIWSSLNFSNKLTKRHRYRSYSLDFFIPAEKENSSSEIFPFKPIFLSNRSLTSLSRSKHWLRSIFALLNDGRVLLMALNCKKKPPGRRLRSIPSKTASTFTKWCALIVAITRSNLSLICGFEKNSSAVFRIELTPFFCRATS